MLLLVKCIWKDDCDELKSGGWEDADIYDALDHAAFLFKNSKILKAYSQ